MCSILLQFKVYVRHSDRMHCHDGSVLCAAECVDALHYRNPKLHYAIQSI